jgi:hypothetical protein
MQAHVIGLIQNKVVHAAAVSTHLTSISETRQHMNSNVGGIDRALRIIIGSALLLTSMTTNSIGLWGVLGMIPIISGFMQYCPLYGLIGFSSCKTAAA